MPDQNQQHILERTVRFSINTDGSSLGCNSAAGKPTINTLGRYYEISIAIIGQPDPQTGYLLGIQEIDAIVRNHLIPIISAEIATNPSQHPANLLSKLWDKAQAELKPSTHTLNRLCWHLTPYHSIEMNNPNTEAILIAQHYEFAAAHRLHTPTLTDQENTDFFGKCNNPSGHGHNYKLKPTIRVPLNLLNTTNIQLQIEQAVNDTIITPLDHKFLNTDCPAFDQSNEGVIPSVENITKHCYESLDPSISKLGCTLESITVWETDRTSATYPA
jgi:6-pyruvoyltetrahydropterin/6-carboxytetrahydropterin synthase